MSALDDIVLSPDPRLKQECAPIEHIDDNIKGAHSISLCVARTTLHISMLANSHKQLLAALTANRTHQCPMPCSYPTLALSVRRRYSTHNQDGNQEVILQECGT